MTHSGAERHLKFERQSHLENLAILHIGHLSPWLDRWGRISKTVKNVNRFDKNMHQMNVMCNKYLLITNNLRNKVNVIIC